MSDKCAEKILKLSVPYIKQLNKQSLSNLLETAKSENKLLYQPRCGVGDHNKMKNY
jgi:hypothetical protein